MAEGQGRGNSLTLGGSYHRYCLSGDSRLPAATRGSSLENWEHFRPQSPSVKGEGKEMGQATQAARSVPNPTAPSAWHECLKKRRSVLLRGGSAASWTTGVPHLQETRTPLGPYRRPRPRVLGGSQRDGRFLWARYPCTEHSLIPPDAAAPPAGGPTAGAAGNVL